MKEAGMRILVVGAGHTGARVLRELQKNPKITIITVDPSEMPFAVKEGIIESVDILESLTPLNLEYVFEQARPDLTILTRTSDDLGLGLAPGMDILAEALREELIAISEVPMIEVSRRGL
jgi:FlaA1/EpsC-like NDP-sugar epimerase